MNGRYLIFLLVAIAVTRGTGSSLQCNLTTEYHEQCGRRCEPSCKVALLPINPCQDVCDPPACHCKFGLFRHNGKCIPAKDCPLNEFQCPVNEKANMCGNLCELSCRKINATRTTPCPPTCNGPKCVCKDGFARKGYFPNHKCVLITQCQLSNKF